MSYISIKNLNFYYGSAHVLKNISMEIGERTATALIGPSGCGKSTFLRTLNRLNELSENTETEGCICCGGADIYADNVDVNKLRRNIGMVFQRPNPFPMSIYNNVAYGLRCCGIKNKSELDDRVKDALCRAALWDEISGRLKKSALGLSGGQQQRLCIARALAVKPHILLMDEPTAALDPVSGAKIEELILRLKERYTIIIVTHNMQQAARVADNAAFFLAGELVEYGSADKLFYAPGDRRTKAYINGSLNFNKTF